MRFFLIISVLALSVTSCRSCSSSNDATGVCIYDEHTCSVVDGQTETKISSRLCDKLTETACKNLETDIDKQKFCTADYDIAENSMITNTTFFQKGECPETSAEKVEPDTTGACFFTEEVCHIVNEHPQIDIAPHACLQMTQTECESLEDECEAQCVIDDTQDVASNVFCMGDYAKAGDIRKSNFSFFPNSECPTK